MRKIDLAFETIELINLNYHLLISPNIISHTQETTHLTGSR